MRTGTRCTILVKLPVAFSGGSRQNTEPEAGATLATVPSIVVVGQRVDRDRSTGCPGCSVGELRLLEVGVDVDVVAAARGREPLARLHIWPTCTARLPTTPSKGARITVNDRSRSALASAVWNCLRVRCASCCCAFSTATLACAAVTPASRALHGGDGLIAVCLRLLERLAARELVPGEGLLARELELGADRARLGGGELRIRLRDAGLLRGDLLADALDGRLLDRDVVARRLGRERVVAVVDARDDIASLDLGVVGDVDGREVSRDLGRERCGVGADVGIVGGLEETADGPPIVAVPGAEREDEQRAKAENELATGTARPLRRGNGRRGGLATGGASAGWSAVSGARATVASGVAGTSRTERGAALAAAEVNVGLGCSVSVPSTARKAPLSRCLNICLSRKSPRKLSPPDLTEPFGQHLT